MKSEFKVVEKISLDEITRSSQKREIKHDFNNVVQYWIHTFKNHPLSISANEFEKLSYSGWFSKKNIWNEIIFNDQILADLKLYENDLNTFHYDENNEQQHHFHNFKAIIVLKSGVVIKPREIVFYGFKNVSLKLEENNLLLLGIVVDQTKIPFTDNISSEDRDFVINHIKVINKLHKQKISSYHTSDISEKKSFKDHKETILSGGEESKIIINSTSKIIIDGCNLCYKNGKNFIGLAALKKISKTLIQSYSVIVIFDNQILKLLTTSEGRGITQNDLEEALGKGCEVHIVQNKRKADDTIVSFIRNDENSFILSNDKFKSYRKKTDEFDDRLINFEMLGGQAIIHDLGISVKY